VTDGGCATAATERHGPGSAVAAASPSPQQAKLIRAGKDGKPITDGVFMS
jgi:hypothetical protein